MYVMYLPHDRGLPHAKTCNEPACINGADVAIDTAHHEDGDSEKPEKAEEPRGHDAADAVAHEEGSGQSHKESSQLQASDF